jgi:hypothetical protein
LKRIFSLAAALILLALTNLPAQAAPQRFGPFIVFDTPDYIMMDGDFLDGAVQDFRRAMKARPKAKLLILRSSGGYVDVALDIAAAVKSRGLSTAVPNNMHCYSACVYVFFAGRDHVVTGKLGVHRVGEINGQSSTGADAYFQTVRRDIERYVPKNVMKYLVSTPTTSMHVFSRKEIKALSINRAGSNSIAAKFASM